MQKKTTQLCVCGRQKDFHKVATAAACCSMIPITSASSRLTQNN